MREKEWRALFSESLRPEIDEAKKKEQLAGFLKAYEAMRPVHKKTKLQRWLDTAGYLSPVTWILQGVFLCLSVSCIVADFLNVRNFLAVMSPALGLVSAFELLRSFQYRMWELEKTCRYHLPQLLGMKMIVLGTADLVVLLVLGAAGGRAGIGINGIFLSLVIPFLLSNACYLLILKKFRNGFGVGAVLVCGSVLGMFCVWAPGLPVWTKVWYQGMTGGTGALLAASLGLLIYAAASFLKDGGREEKRRWNFG